MKIIVKSSFNLKETELETQSTSLGALLDELSNHYRLTKFPFFDSKSREVYSYCEVLVNGQSYQVLADGLDTRLEDGNRVEIIMFALGGG